MSKLTLLSGQVKNLKVQRMTKSVFSSNTPQKLAEAGGLTAAALGSVYASTVMASSRLKMNQEVEAFSCEVNGVKLVGCFGEVTFMNNHNLEFVVEYINDEKTEAIAHAARNTQRKTIWVSPYQEVGEVANRSRSNKLIVWWCSSAFLFLFVILLFDMFTSDGVLFQTFLKMCGVFAGLVFIIAFILKLIARVEIKDARQAAKVFEVFGYQKPSEVNLFENSFDIQLAMEDKSGKILPDMPKWVYRYRDSDLTGESD